MKPKKITRAVLVYQAGIANVFAVDCLNMEPYGREAQRLLQGDFRSCEMFARGLAAAGATVATASCNMAGDIQRIKWTAGIDDCPFRESARPVWHNCAA